MKELRIRSQIPLSLKFVIGSSLTLLIALSISFTAIAVHQERLIMAQVEKEARAIFKQIVITRKWIADHEGVFVESLPWAQSNPYLGGMGKEAEIRDIKGRRFIKETPAMVTKELSRYARDRELYWFHITSLKLTNPENAPDALERRALEIFERKGLREFLAVSTEQGAPYLRYISPLYVEKACLNCHGHQGYKVGDVRGAISVTIPLRETFAEIREGRMKMVIGGGLTVLSLMAAMFLMMKRLVLTPLGRLKGSIRGFSEDKGPVHEIVTTGDEIEELSRSFAEMSQRLTEYHNSLNEKIADATEGLEGANKRLREANRLLNEASERKSDFIAGASHELRTPLTSIKGGMDYISARIALFQEQHPDDTSLDDLATFFQLIKKNSERLIRMVNDMLDIEKIETGVVRMHISELNLSYLLAEVTASFQVEAREKKISLQTLLPDNLPVHADEERISQVMINLFANALKFSPEGGEIIVIAYPEKGCVVTEIWDEGPGVPPEEQEKIFAKFYKKGNREGSGLGLAICKSIVDAHYGIIGV
ncbi:MAG: DUF3365 domain-containing protein, partial [Thermodesulfovibrionales bacterium]